MGVDLRFLFDHQLGLAELRELPARLDALGAPAVWRESLVFPLHPDFPGSEGSWCLEGQGFWLDLYIRTAVLSRGTRLGLALRDAGALSGCS